MGNTGLMTPNEARLAGKGAALLKAHFDGDIQRRDELLAFELEQGAGSRNADGVESELADGLSYMAVVGATMLCQLSGQSMGDALAGLPQPKLRLLPPPVAMPWPEALALIAAIPQSNALAASAGGKMDVPGAVNATFAVAVSAFTQLQQRTGRSATSILRGITDALTAEV
jgi:hypothetical protein